MSALISAARRGLSVKGAVLYCTTLPCHVCAPLIIGAGIDEVVFIEAYPKSRVFELHSDSAVEEGPATGKTSEKSQTQDPRVVFRPFEGFAPRRLMELFSWIERKQGMESTNVEGAKAGTVVDWSPKAPMRPVFEPPNRALRALHYRTIAEREKYAAHWANALSAGLDRANVRS